LYPITKERDFEMQPKAKSETNKKKEKSTKSSPRKRTPQSSPRKRTPQSSPRKRTPPKLKAKQARKIMVDDEEARTEVLRNIFEKHTYVAGDHTYCWECELAPSKNKGYVQASYKQCRVQTINVLSFIDKEKRDVGQGMHVSHLCGNTKCYNPQHLIEESALQNNARKNCLVWVDCPHCNAGTGVIMTCTHDPRCIKRFPATVTTICGRDAQGVLTQQPVPVQPVQPVQDTQSIDEEQQDTWITDEDQVMDDDEVMDDVDVVDDDDDSQVF
jgi:hypothetical protein